MSPGHLYGKKGKTLDFSKAIVVYDIKVDLRNQLNKLL